jgi:hypothetical protein
MRNARDGPTPSFKEGPSDMSEQRKKRSLSYGQLLSGDRAEIESLADADMLDDATLSRAAHLGRFFEMLGPQAPIPICKSATFSQTTKFKKSGGILPTKTPTLVNAL